MDSKPSACLDHCSVHIRPNSGPDTTHLNTAADAHTPANSHLAADCYHCSTSYIEANSHRSSIPHTNAYSIAEADQHSVSQPNLDTITNENGIPGNCHTSSTQTPG